MAREKFTESLPRVEARGPDGISLGLYEVPIPKPLMSRLDGLRAGYFETSRMCHGDRSAVDYKRMTFYPTIATLLTHELRLGLEDDGHEDKVWENLAVAILKTEKKDGVVWDKDGPRVSEEFLQEEAGVTDLVFRPIPFESWRSVSTAKKVSSPSIQKIVTKDGNVFYKFRDPNLLYFLAANYFLKIGDSNILDHLREEKMLEAGRSARYVPLYSFLGEAILFQNDRLRFQEFIQGLAIEVGGIGGLQTAAAVVSDLTAIYSGKRELLDFVMHELQKRYTPIAYFDRPPVIDPAVRTQAIAQMAAEGPSSFFEEIFKGVGATYGIEDLFPADVRGLVRRISETALDRRKAEAGTVLVLADILGYDKKKAIWLAKLMQVAWAAILTIDDVIDFHTVRDGKPTIPVQEGTANAIETSLLSIFNIVESALKQRDDGALAESVTGMLSHVYTGDMEGRNLCWDREEQVFAWGNYDYAKYEAAMREIAKIFSWFPEYANCEVGLEPACRTFAQYVENLGCLILFVNDMEDIAAENKHKAGNDIGRKISLAWGQFMKLELAEEDEYKVVLKEDQTFVKENFDALRLKRRNGQELDLTEAARFDDILRIGRKYLSRIMESLETRIEPVFENARKSLEEAFRLLPNDNGQLEVRNQFYRDFFNAYLDNLWSQMQYYKSYRQPQKS